MAIPEEKMYPRTGGRRSTDAFKQGSNRYRTNQNHQLNWWYAPALKGHITGERLKVHRIVRQSHYFYRPPLKRPFLCLGILVTRKRVIILFERYLVCRYVLL